MNGADSLVQTLLDSGTGHVLNQSPGYVGMHFVAALDHVPGMQDSILVLQERWRRGGGWLLPYAGKGRDVTLLHLPGLANGTVSNLHNGPKKAGSAW